MPDNGRPHKNINKMKHLKLLLGAALLCISLQVSGQTVSDLVGKWNTIESEKDDDMEFTANTTYTFNEDGTFIENGYCQIYFKLDAESQFMCDFNFNGKGTFTVADGVINYVYDAKSAKITEGKNEFPGILKVMLLNPLKNEIKKELKKPSSDRIVSLGKDKMVLISLTDKDPEEQTYTKE